MVLDFMYMPRGGRIVFAVLRYQITQRGNRREPVFFKDTFKDTKKQSFDITQDEATQKFAKNHTLRLKNLIPPQPANFPIRLRF